MGFIFKYLVTIGMIVGAFLLYQAGHTGWGAALFLVGLIYLGAIRRITRDE